ncbi:hypothetical protein RUM43_001711 [Polyplax serrata]|uniref:Uncharacterized protein n=1 Tax=Polyplax serrata TaxID=468196 RepID=A0AAN8SF67_POLSC
MAHPPGRRLNGFPLNLVDFAERLIPESSDRRKCAFKKKAKRNSSWLEGLDIGRTLRDPPRKSRGGQRANGQKFIVVVVVVVDYVDDDCDVLLQGNVTDVVGRFEAVYGGFLKRPFEMSLWRFQIDCRIVPRWREVKFFAEEEEDDGK